MTMLRFKAVGDLPAPVGHPAPQIFLCPYHPFFEVARKGALAFRDETDESKDSRNRVHSSIEGLAIKR